MSLSSFDPAEPAKSLRAKALIREALGSGKGVVSYQVVQEFLNVAVRKALSAAIAHASPTGKIEVWSLASFEPVAAPAARKPPLRPARASTAQTPARPGPPESAGTLQSALATIPGREVPPDSTGSDSLSRSSRVPAVERRAVRPPAYR